MSLVHAFARCTTESFFAAQGILLARSVARLRRPPYKEIVRDGDHTLWQGVCGEDGPLGVRITPPYRALQEFVLRQQARGMVVCLGSKNREEDARDVLRDHPEMVLRPEHLVAHRIH